MKINIFDSYNSPTESTIKRHISTLLLAILLNWILWFCLSQTHYQTLSASLLRAEIFEDIWTTALETLILFEASLVYSRWIIITTWKVKLSFRTLVSQCLILLVANFLSAMVIALFYGWIDSDMAIPDYRNRIILCDGITVYFATSIFFVSYVFNRHREEEKKLLLAERKDLESKNNAMQAQLEKLALTMDNHFVFNSLSTLSGLIRHNQDKAEEFLDLFSRIYRYLVSSSKKRVVTFDQEISFTEDYIEMARIRYPGIQFYLDDSCHNVSYLVSPVSIQAMVENAIRHNRHGENDGLYIRVYVQGDYICIENNLLPRRDQYTSTHTGLNNLDERYKLICGKGIRVSRGPDSFLVRIPIIDINDENIDY